MDNTLLMDNTLWAPLTYLLEVSWSCVFGTPPLGTAFAAVRRRPSSLLSEIGDANDRTRPGRLLLLLSSPSFDRRDLASFVVVVGDTGKIALSCQIAMEGSPLRSRRNGSGVRAALRTWRVVQEILASLVPRHDEGGSQGFLSQVEW